MASFNVGVILRQERLRQDLSLDEIARQTKISPRYLEIIEAAEFERLPGLVFTRNFVRQYALLLKLDPAPLLAALPAIDLASAPLPNPPPRVRQTRWNARWNSAVASVAWFGLAAGVAGAAWVHFNRPASNHAEIPVRVENVTPRSVPAPPPNPVAAPVQVLLTAREPSWVQVTADGKAAFIGTLNANDSRSIDADSLVKVVTGNAGGLEISLNGKVLDPIGPSGQARTVTLTAEGPRFVRKTPPPAPDPL